MNATELMARYMLLPPEERGKFDRYHARRVWYLAQWARIRRATPEQLRRVKEILATNRYQLRQTGFRPRAAPGQMRGGGARR